MSTISKLLGRSPFGLLQRHMEQVAKCVAKMEESLGILERRNWEDAEKLADEVSKLEHQADQIKDEIRDKLRRRLFMLVHRAQFQEILAIQDNLADTAEDVAVLLTIRRLDTPSLMMDEFRRFCDVNLRAFRLAESIINELDELMETGFGGAEAEKVRTVIHDIAYTEHQADVLQRSLLKKILSDEAGLSAADLSMWIQLVKDLSRISNYSENLADSLRITLDLK
jgi:predicted phosphate transport protein (TIGR00153 family)